MSSVHALILTIIAAGLLVSLIRLLVGGRIRLRANLPLAALLVANLALSVGAMAVRSTGTLFYLAAGAFALLVVVPGLLAGLVRGALRRGSLLLAHSLLQMRQVLQPGAGSQQEAEALRGLILARGGHLEEAVALHRQRLAGDLDPTVRIAVAEQLVMLLMLDHRFTEVIELVEREGGISLAAASPQVCGALVWAYAERDRLNEAARCQEMLEANSLALGPAATTLVNQARLAFLAHLGRAQELTSLLADGKLAPDLGEPGRLLWLGVAWARAGREERARELWQQVAGQAEDPRAVRVAHERLGAVPAAVQVQGEGVAALEDLVRRVVAGARSQVALIRSRGRPWHTAPVTMALLGIIVALFLVVELLGGSEDNWTLQRFGANFVLATLHGQPWRLVTSMFLHAGILHLLVNAYALYILGRLVEQLVGSLRFFVVYMGAGVAGSAASALFGEAFRLSVGASGAIFGLLGAALVTMVRMRGSLPEAWRRQVTYNLLIIIALNLYLGYAVARVDNSAHMGGLVGGVGVSLVLLLLTGRPKRASGPARRRIVQALAGILALLTVASGVLAAVTLPRRMLRDLPQKQMKRRGVTVRVPAHWILLEEAELALQDPLLQVAPTLQFEVVLPGTGGERDLGPYAARRTRELVRELGGLSEAAEVSLVQEPAPGMSVPGVVQTQIQVRVRSGLELQQINLFRRQGPFVILALVRLPKSLLQTYGEVVQEVAGSVSYGP